ncbi:MAG: carbohydrate ABC transporter substrate-binding protein [Halanaerobiales bacterium]|nr:carbohydrate ABC transporter substrate-binding protein [Halanaerobiales bacterium]
MTGKISTGLTLFLLISLLLFSLQVAAQDGKVTVMGVWGGGELDAFNKMVEPFEAASGIEVQYEGTRDLPTLLTTRLEAGNPPDIVAVSGPGMMKDLAEDGDLVDLKNVFNMNYIKEDFDQKWIDLATYEDGMYAIYIAADAKSLVWYNPNLFEENGYEIPETWDELDKLAKQMQEDGISPWSIGLESGAASGWPGTDWIEDIMLRTASPETYDKWVAHDIPWTDEKIKNAFEIFGKYAKDPDMVWGGATAVLSTNFGDAPNPLFDSPPKAGLHRQASFITSFIQDNNPELEAGEDFNFFPLPLVDEEYGTPALGAADMLSMINDNQEARQFIKYLATPGAQSIWLSELGKLGTHNRINPNVYPNDITKQMAEFLNNAETFRFDASDSMPAAVGSGSFWQGILDYVSGQDLDSVLEQIERTADDSYSTGEATN